MLAIVSLYLVEAYASRTSTTGDLRSRAAGAADALAAMGIAVRHVTSILVPSDETCFHVFEADSAETVRRVADAAGIPTPRIMEAAS